jgi:hypothetical protein
VIPHDHNDLLERVWTQFQNATFLLAVLEKLFVKTANTAEELLYQATLHNIIDATGLQLDDLGAELDLPRALLGGLSDDAYRAALIIRARSIFAGGTIPDFTDLLRALLPLDVYPDQIPVIEWFPANVRIYLQNITPEQANLFKVLLEDVLPGAGIGAGIAAHDDKCVTFSSSHGPVTTLGWLGSSHGPTSTEAGWRHLIKI